jgi:hypothetical protein
MNENDGHEMLVARMKALEAIALECFFELCAPFEEEKEYKRKLEAAIEERAPGCGHKVET